MNCPCCSVPMETQKIATMSFDVCHSCLGVWIPIQAIKGVIAARAMTSSQFLSKLFNRISKIEQGSFTDKLTGLRNRRFFDRQLYAELARAKGSHFLSMILMDLDGFKTANDTYGHASGDLILKDFGSILAKFIRKSDCAARVGGDEFGVILPETDAAGAKAISERIVEATRTHSFSTLDGQPIVELIQVSCGVAAYPTDFRGIDTEDVDELSTRIFALSDAALYAAKDNGKGRTVYVGDMPEDELASRSAAKQEP